MQNNDSLKQQCLNQLIGQQRGRHCARRQVTTHRETTGGDSNDRGSTWMCQNLSFLQPSQFAGWCTLSQEPQHWYEPQTRPRKRQGWTAKYGSKTKLFLIIKGKNENQKLYIAQISFFALNAKKSSVTQSRKERFISSQLDGSENDDNSTIMLPFLWAQTWMAV